MVTDTKQSAGARIEGELHRRGLTQPWLAQKLGSPLTTVHRKLKGEKYEFAPTELVTIAEALGISPLTLLPAEFFSSVCDPACPHCHSGKTVPDRTLADTQAI